jgi:HlyD family secretion protein
MQANSPMPRAQRNRSAQAAASFALMLATLALAACNRDRTPPPLLGTLEWDRIGVPAEASERIVRVAVREGQQVEAGALLMELDPARMAARRESATASVAQARERVAELSNGSRVEQLDAARAAVASARASQVEAQRQFTRQSELAAKQLVARASLDAARATRDRAAAQVAAAEAQLRELSMGTRPEQVAQAQAAVDNAEAALRALDLDRARLRLHAPRAGRVDALPFKAGDQPPAGATLVSLLVGDRPYARVFIPESQRVALREGQAFAVTIQGLDGEHAATLRSVAREPAFTPYYALTGDDASRLVYRAELEFTAADAARLPAGLPVQSRIAR